MEIEKPFDIFHKIIEHHPVKTRNKVLFKKSSEWGYQTRKSGVTYLEWEGTPVRSIPEEKQSIYQLVLSDFPVDALLRINIQSRPTGVQRTLTWKPFETIFSARAHVHISLRNILNVRNSILVSGLSSTPSFVVNSVGGGNDTAGGGKMQTALNSAS